MFSFCVFALCFRFVFSFCVFVLCFRFVVSFYVFAFGFRFKNTQDIQEGDFMPTIHQKVEDVLVPPVILADSAFPLKNWLFFFTFNLKSYKT